MPLTRGPRCAGCAVRGRWSGQDQADGGRAHAAARPGRPRAPAAQPARATPDWANVQRHRPAAVPAGAAGGRCAGPFCCLGAFCTERLPGTLCCACQQVRPADLPCLLSGTHSTPWLAVNCGTPSPGASSPRATPGAGLTLLNLSLDTLGPARFETMTRRPAAGLQRVLDTLEHAVDLGFDPVKVGAPSCA